MTKLQLTLTDQEADLVSLKAAQLGYKLTRFVKFLVSREAAEVVGKIPTFNMSKKAEKVALEARQEYEKGKAKKVAFIADLVK